MELKCSILRCSIILCLFAGFYIMIEDMYYQDFKSNTFQMEPHHAEDKLQPDQAHEDKLQPDQAHEDKLQPDQAHEDKLQPDQAHEDKLQPDQAHEDKLQPDQAHEDKLQPDQALEDKLQHDQAHEDKLQPDQAHEDKLQSDQAHEDKLQPDQAHEDKLQSDQAHEHKLQPDQSHDDKFQFVSNDAAIFVYSAYFDSRNHTVRVIGITKLISPTLYCLLRYFGTQSKYIKAEVEIMPDHHGKPYKPMFIVCGLKSLEVPYQLSISNDTNVNKTSNILIVKKIPNSVTSTRGNFTVCLSPLHSLFKAEGRLLEWLELNILLGVAKFYVYVHSCTKNVMQLLQTYQSKGYVVVINWTLPPYLCKFTGKKLHYFGQMAALNDCLYRTKGISSYVVSLDVDEFIIPQLEQDKTWNDMLLRLPKASAYNFRNVFFLKNNSNTNTTLGLITQSRFFREDLIYKQHDRSKYFAVADNMEILGIHYPWKLKGIDHTVSHEIGLVHHYRETNFKYTKDKWIQNNVTKKYARELQKRMVGLWNKK